jgi:uncharacterized protein YjdB
LVVNQRICRWLAAVALAIGFVACDTSVIPSDLAQVVVGPQPAQVELDEALQLEVTFKNAAGDELGSRDVFWSSENSAIAVVSATGVVTGKALGSTRIAASADGINGLATVTVVDRAVVSVTITPPQANLLTGQTVPLSAVARDRSNRIIAGRAVTWSVQDARIAAVNGSGTVTGVAAGSTQVTATVDGTTGGATVNVSQRPVATVEVSPGSASLPAGNTLQFSATARASDGSVVSGRPIAWSSSNPAVATVSDAGVATAANPGATTITALIDGKSGSATLTVPDTPVASVEIVPTSAQLTTGQTRQFTAITKAENGSTLTGRTITWSSSNPQVATVDANGLVTAGLVLTTSQATITATSEGKSASATVTVSLLSTPVATVVVEPSSAEFSVGETQQFVATLRSSSGATLTGRQITWSSSDTRKATVDATGLARGVAVGEVTITATSEGKKGKAEVEIHPSPTTPTRLSIVSGDDQRGENGQPLPNPLVVKVENFRGEPLAGIEVRWSTDNGSVSPTTSTTAADGQASTTWTLGDGSRSRERLAWAQVTGLPRVEFEARRSDNDD